ncbi:MAG: hypothetical protein KJ646_04400 [Nanoarchaeota archaeon]|nr:hypothetical protein [Nanoarchaeota archaeon]
MLKVVLVIDCERFISFKQGNPRWNKFEKFKGKINNLIKNLRYNEKGFEIVYKTIVREEFPATFMLVGKMFKPIKSPSFIEFGSHTLNHLPLTLVDDDLLKQEIENKYKFSSITPPMWMVEDTQNPLRIFNELKKQKYTHCVYRGKNTGIKHFHYNAVKKPFKKQGITCVHVSNFLEGNFSHKKINNLKKDILKNTDKQGVYLLTTHDFTHKNNKNLKNIIKFLKQLEKNNKIKIMRLKDIK